MNTIFSISDHFKKLLEKSLAYLGVDGVTVVISVNTRMLDKLAEEGMELTAATFPSTLEKTYNLYVRGTDIRDVVICHEAVHISQYADGRLTMVKGKPLWEGEEYGKNVNYYARPWEREAYKLDSKILKAIR